MATLAGSTRQYFLQSDNMNDSVASLNSFYARFERENTTTAVKIPAAPNDPVNSVSEPNVRLSLKRVNPRKAKGPNGVPGKALKTCANQRAGILKDTFNLSLPQAEVPTCFKRATIIPVPKKNNVGCLNDYRPVLLTSTVMKCFERLVMTRLNSCLSKDLDPLQFDYYHNRPMADTISMALHMALEHLDNTNTYIRMLFIDYSSAFNTIIPTILIEKLQNLGLCTSLCNLILNFLTGRPQSVWIGDNIFSLLTVSTGAPHGVCLVHCSTLYIPLTVWIGIAEVPSINLLMIQPLLVESQVVMRGCTGVRYAN
ncbi:uncharacterized protein LOC134347753 [Mobula hypostoma]|uniref:uncharacterized protein LOC134347753 n=1 Tax=Mobula hypostoma TaxID=723540 RepID=UPI002FC32394